MAGFGRDMNVDTSGSTSPFVSIVIPCREEKRFIGNCLDSLLTNDYPTDRFEILVVDGRSRDGTREIVEAYTTSHSNVRLLDNEQGIIPTAMNIGIRTAKGEIIMKIDAHCRYAHDYISRCVSALERYGAANVGGVLVTVARQDGLVAQSIALVLAHPFGSGNSYFRIGGREPRWSDTVAFGCYRRAVFDRIGYFDENLTRSSDMDLNIRLRRVGGGILLVPDIKAYYYPSSVTFGGFLVRNVVDGFWVFYPLRFGGRSSRLRHVVPAACVVTGGMTLLIGRAGLGTPPLWALSLGLYLATTLAVAAHVAWQRRRLTLMKVLALTFMIRHVGYGIGSLAGLVVAVAFPAFWRNLARRRRTLTREQRRA